MATVPASSPSLPSSVAGAAGRRAALVAVVLASLAAAVAAVELLPGRVFEPDLARVILLMATLKGAIAGLVVALVGWRAGASIAPLTYALALGIVALMVAAPILVWHGTMLGVTSLLFQGSLLALAALALYEHRHVTAAGRD